MSVSRRPLIVVGYGRVGGMLAGKLQEQGQDFTVIEDQDDRCADAAGKDLRVVRGNAAQEAVLRRAGICEARAMLVAIPEGYEAAVVTERAKRLNPDLAVIARAHSDEEAVLLQRSGADHVVLGEQELAMKMLSVGGAAG